MFFFIVLVLANDNNPAVIILNVNPAVSFFLCKSGLVIMLAVQHQSSL